MKTFAQSPFFAPLLIAFFVVINTVYNGTLPLFLDEAYYWVWSTKLQAGYFDHPPMVALFLRIASFFGESEAALRLAAAVPMGVGAYFAYRAAFEAFGQKAALWTLGILLLCPAAAVGFTIASPDAPLAMFWGAALYFSYRAFFGGRLLDFLLAGACIGAAMASKYTAVLFLLFLAVFLVWRMPKMLIGAKSIASLAVALLVFSPVIVWNAQNDWISFLFQYRHGTAEVLQLRFDKLFEFLGGLFVLFSPLVFGIALWGATKFKEYRTDDKVLFFALSCFVPLLFFCYKALFKKMELNWAAVALFGGAVFVGYLISKYKFNRLGIASLTLAVLLSLVAKFPLLFGLTDGLNPHNRLFGYREAISQIQKELKPNDTVFADHLTTAAMLTYYMDGHPDVFIPVDTRPSQYSLWQSRSDWVGKSGLILCTADRFAELKTHFKTVSQEQRFTASRKGFRDRIVYIYRVEGFLG